MSHPVKIIAEAVHTGDRHVKTGWGLALDKKDNPKGEGALVYLPINVPWIKGGPAVWLVLDEKGYPLNGPAKKITPTLPWPREAPVEEWKRTGLNPYIATEALEIVYGEDVKTIADIFTKKP